jgi:hypothetical protein
MNELKKYEGSPFSITVYDKDLELGQKRAKLWKQSLEQNLLHPAADFDVKVALPGDRGDITQVQLGITK